ncbi:MAG TPA: hypothetical protein VMV91_12315 [Rhodocyclaceae bacterium]|nr:hypothetical protein [Rhodocyclaceae bacterium]
MIYTAPSRGEAASRLYLSCYRRTASADFYSVRAFSRSARRLRRQHKAAHGFSGYAGAVLNVLHFVARRRLPAVKRTAAMPGRVGLQDQDRATCCIAHPFGGYAAKNSPRPVLIPAPFRRSHTPKANPLRGIASQNQPS